MTDDHLSLDELAELDEGLLPPERTSVIRAHLHGCATCRDRAESITRSRDLLGDLPPLMMPPDVQARLDDALATEAAAGVPEQPSRPTSGRAAEPPPDTSGRRDPAPPASVGDTSDDVVPAPGTVSRPRFGRPTMAATAVAAAVVLAVGAIVIGALNHGHQQDSETAGPSVVAPLVPDQNGVAGAPAAHFFQTSTGRDYTLTNLQPDVQGLIARPSDTAVQPASPSNPPSAGAGGAAAGATRGGGSGTNQPTHHKSGARPSTSATPSPSARSSASTLEQQPTPKPLQPLAGSQARILACAAALTGQQDAVPLAVDFGRWTNPPYHRVPSAIFVFSSNTATTVRVFVTPPACDSGMLYAYRLVPLAQ